MKLTFSPKDEHFESNVNSLYRHRKEVAGIVVETTTQTLQAHYVRYVGNGGTLGVGLLNGDGECRIARYQETVLKITVRL